MPTMQTDKPFTYKVDEHLTDQLGVGMRVVVPFGKGNRLIQGFVTRIFEQTDYQGELKKVAAVLELAPVLNDESLQLAEWMARETFSFRISCMQAMLPSAMRAQYQKKVVLLTDQVSEELKAFFADKSEQIFDEQKISTNMQGKLLKARRQKQVEIKYLVKNKARAKKIMMFQSKLTEEIIEEEKSKLRVNANKLRKLLSFLRTHPKIALTQAQFEKKIGLTAGVLRAAEKKGWLLRQESEQYRDPRKNLMVGQTIPKNLTSQQREAVEAVLAEATKKHSTTFLLQGVTGSGKTEVYLQVIAKVLAAGKAALMLVPEISLTPQMVERVTSRFGEKVALLHSGLSSGEKFDEWRRIEKGEAQVVVGARSAIFAPLKKLGIIIIDEEHETSYKQDNMPRYHARDVAKWRAEYHHCPVLLGSATPSLESRARAQKGVYRWLHMDARINQQPLPKVKIVDMREEVPQSKNINFSEALLRGIKQTLERHEQIILMLNRRGYSSFMMCRDCGFVLKCPNCDISLTLHMDTHSMKCHYCGHEEAIPQVCPSCKGRHIRYYGTGTQQVEVELQKLFSTARILRMDVDTTRRKGAHTRILNKFGQHEADILLGTQMIAKGLDYPDVTLVGVLNADTALGMTDFRASEKTFQLLTQVSGRAGRATKKGQVIIQTYNPHHYAIQLAKEQNYEKFFRKEMSIRHQGAYPPYYYTIQIVASSPEESLAAKKMYQIYAEIRKYLSNQAVILGPTPQAVARINNRYFYQLIVKYKKEKQLFVYLDKILYESQKDERKGLKIMINREPLNFV
ncbi:DNA replication factor Y [Liquorilactobacillus capillatus DSM 19910]|uniref:Replication restart protein PriA n=1 Tax=Liquorilactobacillus capillatus DSM 19910 TaxID=1423731 RepID=A0A0R1LYK5_9LACO|nr:DNA replication factor Y [Liquorilactobacillus capillatus DSM 19910]